MLTERIVHVYARQLLGNVEDPDEEKIELFCELLTSLGGSLDTPKARGLVNVYFSRVKELTKSPTVSVRVQNTLFVCPINPCILSSVKTNFNCCRI